MATLDGRGGSRTNATSAVAGSLLSAPARPAVQPPQRGELIPTGETTAEIPIVGGPRAKWETGARHEKAYSVLLPDGTLWYGSNKRLPAPFALRLLVWLLVFLLLAGGAGLAVEHEHPSWLQFLQNTASGAPAAAGAGQRSPAGTTTPPDTGFHLVSSKAGAAAYATGTSSFTIVITFAHPVWTVVVSPAGSKNFLVESVLYPSASPKSVPITGSASVIVSAATESIAVTANGKTLGTITQPEVETTYSFSASGH